METTRSSGPLNLEDFKGRDNLVLVFAPSKKSPAYEKQMEQFRGEEAAFEERDLLLGEILAQGESKVGDRRLDESAAEDLRDHFGIAPDAFRLVLIGKGGEEIRRFDAPALCAVVLDELGEHAVRRS